MWKHFTIALSFLTIVRLPGTPAGEITPADLAKSFTWFPVVGFLLGSCLAAVAWQLQSAPPLLLAVMLTALLAGLTRGLHLDGLADLADGLGGGYTPERRLEIMKDSRTGAFGALALIFAVFLKSAALYTLVLGHCWIGVLLAPVISRFAMVMGAYHIPYARNVGGLARPFLEHVEVQQLVGAGLMALGLGVAFSLKVTALYLGLGLVCAGLLRWLGRRWLGGMTGDVLGALNEITEVVLLGVAAGCFCG